MNEKNGRQVEGTQPIIAGMAGRYASALFELALEEKALDAVKTDLDTFDALVADSADLDRLVRSPVFGADEKLKALSAILDKAGIKGLAANFLRVLTTNRRLFAARDVIRGYRALVARHRGEVSAQVTVAEKLSDKNLEALKDALKSKTAGKNIDLDVKIDPAIIGGLIVKVGSQMVDSSLRTKLNSIKLAMKEAR
jgi:F-type H+-transporting ATPase subunit delta